MSTISTNIINNRLNTPTKSRRARINNILNTTAFTNGTIFCTPTVYVFIDKMYDPKTNLTNDVITNICDNNANIITTPIVITYNGINYNLIIGGYFSRILPQSSNHFTAINSVLP